MGVLQLFKNCKYDNIKRISNLSDLTAQNTYFESLLNNDGIEKTVSYNKIGENIVLDGNIDDVIGYNYGRIKIKDYWYYFSVDDIFVNNNSKTEIKIRLDCWETARYQFGITLGQGHIYRLTNPTVALREDIIPSKVTYTITGITNTPWSCVIVFVRMGDYSDVYALTQITDTCIGWIKQGNIGMVIRSLTGISTISDNDIIGAWLCPFDVTRMTDYYTHENYWTLREPDTVYAYLYKYNMNIGSCKYDILSDGIPESYITFEHTDTHIDRLTDMRKNVVFEPEYNKTVRFIWFWLDVTPTTCNLVFSGYVIPYENLLDRNVTIPCEPLTNFVDSYVEYFVRQRDTDIQTRKMNNDKQYLNGMISNTGTGAIGGAMAGGGGGAMGGALLGAGMSFVNWGMNEYLYNPQEQKILDNHYQKQKDELNLIGDCIEPIVNASGETQLYKIRSEFSTQDKNRYNSIINAIGKKCDTSYIDCDSMIQNGYFSGDVEIIGNIPDIWKAQIRQRLKDGVIFG